MALALAMLALIGWALGAPLLYTLVPSRPPMQPVTALSLACCGVGVLARVSRRASPRVARLAGFLVAVVATLVLAEYAFGWSFGFEGWFFSSRLPFAGRPSPPTAAALFLLGAALLVDDRPRWNRVVTALAFAAAFIALWALAGHLFGGGLVYRFERHPVIGVALHTAVALELLAIALVLGHPDRSPARLFLLPSLGGYAARRLFVAAVGFPIFVGIVVELARLAGLHDVPLALGLLAASTIPVSLSLVIAYARAIDRADAARAEMEERFRASFEQASDAIFIADRSGLCTHASETALSLFGPEIIGRSLAELVSDEEQGRVQTALIEHTVETFHGRLSLRSKDGELVPAEVHAKMLSNGSLLVAARDVRDRVAAEKNLERAREAERHGREQLESIVEATDVVSDALASLPSSDVATILKTIALQAQALTHARYAAIGLVEDGVIDAPFGPWIFSGISPGDAAKIGRTPGPKGLLGVVAREGRTLRIADIHAHPASIGFPAHHPPMKSFLGVPIRYRGKPVGNLYLAEKTDAAEFSEEDERLATLLAHRVGTAIETARLYQIEATGRSWLQDVLDQSPDAVIVTDAKGAVTSTNRAALTFTTATPGRSDIFGGVLRDLRRPNGEHIPMEERPLSRAIMKLEVTRSQELLVRRTDDGRDVPVVVSATPIWSRAGVLLGAVEVIQDISALRELENLREQWTSVIAHDLRQPLAVIALSAQSVARRASLDEGASRAMQVIIDSCAKLERMARDLLDASRIEARNLTLERSTVELPPLVHEIVERAIAVMRGVPARVEIRDTIPPVSLDPGRFEQVLFNLLSNAAKYGDQTSEVLVTVEADEGFVEVSVKNRGPCIDPDEIGRLFSRFGRTGAARKRREGAGLGLYITKGLVEAHGGRISVESKGDETTFRCRLPAASEEASEVEAEPRRRRSRSSVPA
ncbi:MAG: ATP-binding protein [Polyangiales bacterium]